jgi:anti-sigma factor RsiW
MQCIQVKAKISAYMDGELDAARARSVADHLEACDACRKEFEAFAAVDGYVHALPQAELPADFAATVASRARLRRPAETSRSFDVFGRLLRFFEAFFNLLGLEVSPATRALDEFNDVPSSFIGYAYFKVY